MARIPTERTCWRGLSVEHPAAWELSLASGAGEPGRIGFADRRYTRLEVAWREVDFVPNLELMMDKYRQRKTRRADEVKFEPLGGMGPDCAA